MTAYTRRNLGGKLFVIEWDLVVTDGVGVSGDFYENDGAELVSIVGFSDSGLNVFLNFSNLQSEAISMNISGIVFVPSAPGFEPAYSPKPVIPPTMRRYNAQAEASGSDNGAARVGLLFKQL